MSDDLPIVTVDVSATLVDPRWYAAIVYSTRWMGLCHRAFGRRIVFPRSRKRRLIPQRRFYPFASRYGNQFWRLR